TAQLYTPSLHDALPISVGKNGMCRCPFHADKTPSMKLNEAYYYCFGCKAHGDVIALTAQLLHLPPGSAAAELAQAFTSPWALHRSEEHTSELQSRFDLV